MTDELSRRIGALSADKRALLEQHLLRRQQVAADDPIRRRRPGDPAPLSFAQQRLWFLDQWAPGNPTYNAALAFRLRGDLDVGRLREALALVIARHEAVRTVFRAPAGEPEQVVLADWNFELPERPVADPAALPGLLREEARRPFDLTRDLMLRAAVFRTGPDEAVLLLVEHHIAFDGWSDAVLFTELAAAYAALGAGRRPELAELPVQYADFALWQRRRLTGPLLDRLVSYWREQLADAPAQLSLPTDRPRPPVQTFTGAHRPFTAGEGPAAAVRALSREEAATPYMTLLAAFVATLHLWTGATDVCVGTPIANRSRVELEPLIGFFSNTLVLRLRPAADGTFRQLVRQVKEAALGAYEHQDLPFEKVVEAVAPPRNPSRNPLFQVNFRVRTGPVDPLRLPGVRITPLPVDVGFSRFDLAMELALADGLAGYLEYNSALLEPGTADAFVRRFLRVLGAAVADPDVPLATLRTAAAAGIRGSRRRPTPD